MSPRTAANMTDHRVLIILLRVGGVLACTAIIASVMPTTWIAATHRWLGLGDFPDAPITQYLARSLSAFYAMHGALALFLSRDVVRFAPVIRCWGAMLMAMGCVLLATDLSAGLPIWWTIAEAPFALVFGAALVWLAGGLDSTAA